MPEWVVEKGIGEERAVRIESGRIVEARIFLEGTARAGTRLKARLKAVAPRVIAEADGQDYLLPKGAGRAAEGAEVVIEVTREAIPGAEPWKRPLATVTDEPPGLPEFDADELPFPSPANQLEEAGWSDLIEEARSGMVRFAGGELRLTPAPAMTLIDVDGHLPPDRLAVAAAEASARAILRLGIGGPIGIDFPTLAGKTQRQAVGEAIDAALPKPFERTAMNGFGFLQIVRPRRQASMLELAQERSAFEARALLRQAALSCRGSMTLVAHPAVIRLLEDRSGWIGQLSRQAGGAVALRADAALPISGGYAAQG